MPRLFASDDESDLVRAERDVREAFTGLDLDLTALAAVSNIFRAATAVRNHMENNILAQHELSWSAFTTLFVLRVWGEMDARSLAAEAGVTAATLTGVMKTLENGQLLNGNMADYLVPMSGEMPDIIVGHVETPTKTSELGAKGAGEAGTAGAPGAVMNHAVPSERGA